ncbi:hypothetical protein HNR19_002530 [Nocardioides thalensis]|uniref:Uncharacterized protein n=1 Tax=Nocardioides thalensis TaxID=1914755 RepID=A0A853C592_9ACTN|nr:hypothetical protein [Nocardioides thalensis]NYJ01832.1 hypothetical protein [Nocardioides thalensis]
MTGQARTAVVKTLKARGAKARRGHLRLQVGELFWYVDVLADGVGPMAPLRLEIGCWTPELPPEPDGGAVDCPLLMDVPLDGDEVTTTERLLDLIGSVGDLTTLRERLPELPGVLVDKKLRDLL